ncbi:sugar transporter domain-containing protein [Ditylenchus destructor]|uniref:Sugar transporter domain-containing protein n=1 Tax=Ditylenchus destructor TaxID=166010 RepID=A0AAD4NGW3_9BILA|nr:sugar transporter domain-containing protein [Ditylenchus destructor]
MSNSERAVSSSAIESKDMERKNSQLDAKIVTYNDRLITKNTNGNTNGEEYHNIDELFKSIGSYGNYQNATWTLKAADVKKNASYACALLQSCASISTNSHWYSMYEEFNWVCDSSEQQHFRAIMQSLMPIGSFVGMMASGHLSDIFGRKWLFIIGDAYSIISGIACALSPSFTVYLWLTAVGSFITPISASTSFSLIVESVNPKYRLIQGFSFQFSLGLMLAAGLATLCRNWRTHLLIARVFGIIPLIMLFKLEESPRFLLQKGHFKAAAAALTRIARFNGYKETQFSEEEMRTMHDMSKTTQLEPTTSRKYTSLSLFATWKMASYSCAQILTGITMNVVNDVLFFNIQDLSGSPFMNTFLMGALRLWTPFAAFGVENGTKTIGRWKLLVFSQGLVFLMFCSMFIIDFTQLNATMRVFGTGAVLVGYILESGLVWIAYKLYTTELFPTCMRSIALSTFSCTSLLGSMATPQMTYFASYWHPAPYAGATVFAGLSVLFAILFLPETHFVALPDNMREATHRDTLYKEKESDVLEKLLERKNVTDDRDND